MTNETIGAFTKSGPEYPAYVNVRKIDGKFILTVRGDPEVQENGAAVCGYPRDKGMLGRCTPGDENCNNYCNLAPEKGPMQPRPKSVRQVLEGKTIVISLTPEEFEGVMAIMNV